MKTKHKKENRGGYREGAGRKKVMEDTKVMRVPLSLVPFVEDLIMNCKQSDDNGH